MSSTGGPYAPNDVLLLDFKWARLPVNISEGKGVIEIYYLRLYQCWLLASGWMLWYITGVILLERHMKFR
jgi:hypothetical protein